MTYRAGIWPLAGILVALAPGPGWAAPAIQIVSATYGGVPDDLRCSALTYVRQHCEGRSACSVGAEPGVCGGAVREDVPLFATLYVTYECASAGPLRSVKAERPFRLHLTCAGGLPE